MHQKRPVWRKVDEGEDDRPLTQGGVPLYGSLEVERISLTAHLRRGPYTTWTGGSAGSKAPTLVPKTTQRVEKLLRAIFCAPFRGLKPRLCSVLGSVSRCLASVFTTDHSENDFFNSLGRFRYCPGPIPFPRAMVPFRVPKAVPESMYRNLAPLGEFRDVHPNAWKGRAC